MQGEFVSETNRMCAWGRSLTEPRGKPLMRAGSKSALKRGEYLRPIDSQQRAHVQHETREGPAAEQAALIGAKSGVILVLKHKPIETFFQRAPDKVFVNAIPGIGIHLIAEHLQ